MADQPKPKKPERKIGDLIDDGTAAAKSRGYTLYKREAESMGEEILTPAQWAAKQRREK